MVPSTLKRHLRYRLPVLKYLMTVLVVCTRNLQASLVCTRGGLIVTGFKVYRV